MLKLTPKRQKETENTKALIIKLTLLFEKDWKADQVSTFLTTYKEDKNVDFSRVNHTKQDLLQILAIIIYKVNVTNPNNFSSSTQLDVKKLETYE